jgi:hypothetical protein
VFFIVEAFAAHTIEALPLLVVDQFERSIPAAAEARY